MRHNRKIEQKWQRKWESEKAFRPGRGKKLFVTVPFPYTSGPLHIGHGRTYTLIDIWARFQRMRGFAVLFPIAYHISGTPILSVADKIKADDEATKKLYTGYVSLYEKNAKKVETIVRSFADPKKVAGYFSSVIASDFKSLGFSIDWSRTFTTGDPQYQKFIEWQFLCLRKRGLIKRGEHAVQFCLRDQNPVGEDDIKDGDILNTRIETYTMVKFPFKDGVLVAATLRPETLFGATNLWVNPNGSYVKARVDGDIWYLSQEGIEKLMHQNHVVKKLGAFPARMLIGEKAHSPVTDREIPVLPAAFVDPSFATGVVYSVPAHSPSDWIALQDLKSDIRPLPVISLPGRGDIPAQDICKKLGITHQQEQEKLSEATRKLYKEEFYKGVLKYSGPFSGIPVKDIKNAVKDWLKKRGIATELFVSRTYPLACRCGGDVVIRVLTDQWFIDYGNEEWKAGARECLKSMRIIPETHRSSFEATIEWLHERACARKRGLGTRLPWDSEWVIESLSDSTIYPAFYLLVPELRDIKPEKLKPEVFDYVLLGRGAPESIRKHAGISMAALRRMRKEFERWYPVDLRHTAVPHISNHLAFYIFNHAALFPKKYWPKAISLNELLIREGSKMSKSRGNVIPLVDITRQYSADLYRLFISYGADMGAVIDWKEESAEMVKKRLEMFREMVKQMQAAKGKKAGTIDDWLASRFNTVLSDAAGHIQKFRFRSYVQRAFFDVMNDISAYLKRGGENGHLLKDTARKWLKLLSPVIPHICEELWPGAGFVSLHTWPKADRNLINPVLEQEEAFVRHVLEDSRTILKLIGKQPKEVRIYTAPPWKYTLHRRVRSLAGKKFSISSLMKIPELRKEGKEAVRFAEKLRKDMGSLGSLLSEEEELRTLQDAREFIGKELGCTVIVEPALSSTSIRATKAEPGKPGIEVVQSF